MSSSPPAAAFIIESVIECLTKRYLAFAMHFDMLQITAEFCLRKPGQTYIQKLQ